MRIIREILAVLFVPAVILAFILGFTLGSNWRAQNQRIDALLTASFEAQYGRNPFNCKCPVGNAVWERWSELYRAFMSGKVRHPYFAAGTEVKHAAWQGKFERGVIGEIATFSWTAPTKIAANEGLSIEEMANLKRLYPTVF